MTTLGLVPFDTLFLRDGRAFSPGDGTEAFGTFPPLPQAIQGLVRSRMLADHCGRWDTFAGGCRNDNAPCDLEETCRVQPVVGRYRQQGSLETRGPWLIAGDQHLLPIPADVVARSADLKTVGHGAAAPLPVRTWLLAPGSGHANSNLPGKLVPLQPPADLAGSDFGSVEGWLNWPAYAQYLEGRAPKLTLGQNWWRSSDLWVPERRPGLAMEAGRNRALDKHLFFAQHTRMPGDPNYPSALGIEVLNGGGLLEPNSGVACPLGGELRAVAVHTSADVPWKAMPGAVAEAAATSGLVKIVVLQPAFFQTGWHPGAWDPAAGSANLDTPTGNFVAHWRAALVGRPEQIGGWDLALRAPKPRRAFVPRGSVFYFEFEKGPVASNAAAALWNHCISESPGDEKPSYPSIGLGHVLSGTWAPKE